jgi:hypothetical protein
MLMEETTMTAMMKTMSPLVKNFFGKSAQKIARETKFVQRKSKMTGSRFLKAFVFGLLENATASLNDLTEFCEDHCGIRISVQALNERIHHTTLLFMKQMFSLALGVFRQTVRLPVPILSQFSAVNITDSTGISLPASVAEEFPGSGGDASVAGLKLQLVMEFLTGSFKAITLTDGITPDQKATQHLALAEPGSLNLFDLGYFVLNHLKTLADKGAYFLCRLLLSTHLYRDDGQKVDLLTMLRVETRTRFELALRVGKDLRLPCRVCFFRAPEEVANRRRQQAKQQAAKKGRQPTQVSLELMGWTILLTNVPASMLSLEHVALLYAVRWQVELIFKLWKSHMKLHLISGIRTARILVELYAKLIGLVLFQFLTMPLRAKDIDLSPTKAFKRFVKQSAAFADALHSLQRLQKVIGHLHTRILKFAKREKRKKRLTTCQQLLLGVDYYA